MFGRLFLLITITTTVELVLLLVAGRYMGILPTIAIILLTGLAGAYLAAREGRKAWRRVLESLGRGELPADPIVQALLVLAGGLLLLTPGYLTDITGFLCLLPPSRVFLAGRIRNYLARRIQTGGIRFGGLRGESDATREARTRPGASEGGRRGPGTVRENKVFDATDQQ